MIRLMLSLPLFTFVVGVSLTTAQETTLQPDAPVERGLSPTDRAHEYAFSSPGDQAFSVVAEQQGIDVVVTVLGPDKAELLQVDNASENDGTGGSEIAEVTALEPGNYIVRVSPFARPDASSAKYRLTLTRVRTLSAAERANAKSEREVAAVEREWEDAIDKADVPTMSRILRSDAVSLGPYASVARNRERVMKDWENSTAERTKRGITRQHTITEHVVRAAGDTAVSTGRAVIASTDRNGNEGRFTGQFVHVWAKDDQGWKMVADYFFPFGRMPRERTSAPSIDPQILAGYAGTYREDGGATLTMTVEHGALMVQRHNLGQASAKMRLTPVSDTTFTLGESNELTFVHSPSGKLQEVLVLSDGPATRATRLK